MTLSVKVHPGCLHFAGELDKVVTFERLEILYFGGGIIFSECHFPRLRHASVEMLSHQSELEIFQLSSHLECLLIRSCNVLGKIYVGSFPRLHVLSFDELRLHQLVPVGDDHPLEHLWLYSADTSINSGLIEGILRRVPGISRITMDISSLDQNMRKKRNQRFERMNLDSLGLALQPIEHGDTLLLIERSASVMKGGIWRKIWGKRRR